MDKTTNACAEPSVETLEAVAELQKSHRRDVRVQSLRDSNRSSHLTREVAGLRSATSELGALAYNLREDNRYLEIRIAERDLTIETLIDEKAELQARLDQIVSPVLVATTDSPLGPLPRIKIAADGSQLPADYAGSDHVAVLFPTLGLMFAAASIADPEDASEGLPHADCEKACAGLNLAGFTDWQLASVEEARILIDYTRSEPAIDTDYFPGIRPRYHWTRTPVACVGVPAFAWGVGFGYGLVDHYPRYGRGFGLAVRRASQ